MPAAPKSSCRSLSLSSLAGSRYYRKSNSTVAIPVILLPDAKSRVALESSQNYDARRPPATRAKQPIDFREGKRRLVLLPPSGSEKAAARARSSGRDTRHLNTMLPIKTPFFVKVGIVSFLLSSAKGRIRRRQSSSCIYPSSVPSVLCPCCYHQTD
jgi:hypothetical protein